MASESAASAIEEGRVRMEGLRIGDSRDDAGRCGRLENGTLQGFIPNQYTVPRKPESKIASVSAVLGRPSLRASGGEAMRYNPNQLK